MKLSALLFFFSLTLIFSIDAEAQRRSSGSTPILVDMIGSSRLPQASSLSAAAQRGTRAKAPTSAASDLERRLFELLNKARAENGLVPIEWDEGVASLARNHSRSMAAEGFFSHRGSDGQTVDGRAFDHGLGGWRAIGENIASMKGHADPGSVALENWLRSSSHRNNILSARWNASGVGIAVAPDGTYYLTQVFMAR